MDRIFSTRMDASVITMIDALSSTLHKSKKSIIEDSVRLYAKKKAYSHEHEILNAAYGCWNRKESPAETFAKSRRRMNKAFSRFAG